MTERSPSLIKANTDIQTDEDRLVAAAKGDPREFDQLYLRYARPVFRYLYARIGSVQEAEDVTAQTFLAAFEAFGKYRHEGCFAAWLFSIARNKATDHFRCRQIDLAVDDAEQIPDEVDPLQKVIQTERAAALIGLINALPEEERELLRLRYVAELSFPEMGRLLERSEEAVKKAVYRLLARLQSQAEVSND
jgi:RNA polymerase sigma-70 factor (ECF subfamily)